MLARMSRSIQPLQFLLTLLAGLDQLSAARCDRVFEGRRSFAEGAARRSKPSTHGCRTPPIRALRGVRHAGSVLSEMAARKYKRLKYKVHRARKLLAKVRQQHPGLFAHWALA